MRTYFAVDCLAGAKPRFVTTALIERLSPGLTVIGSVPCTVTESTVRFGTAVTVIFPDEVTQLLFSSFSGSAFAPSAQACSWYWPGSVSGRIVTICCSVNVWPGLRSGVGTFGGGSFRSCRVPSTTATRLYFVTVGSAFSGPTFFPVSFTVMGCPCPPADGGFEIELMIRSGACMTTIPPAAFVQLLFSLPSDTSPPPSAHAWSVYVPGRVSEYTDTVKLCVTDSPAPTGR